MNVRSKILALVVLLLCSVAVLMAQRRFRYRGEGYGPELETCRTAREVPSHSTGTPNWTNPPGFEKDVFTFTRIRRDQNRNESRSAGDWAIDFPDSDLNLSFRIQQVTSLRVDPDGRVLRLTDPDLFNYPWIYMVEPGSLQFRDEELAPLRKYLLNGGVLMADDFWGEVQWQVFEREIKRVFPDRRFVDLEMTNQLFHCVFDLRVPKNKLQTPNSFQGIRSQYDDVTWENHDGEACREVHFRALYDDKGRIMVFAAHNTDNGDGWEREGEDDYFFHQFSEKRAFPLGINAVFYLMTH
jgi:hypothetical protein